MTDSRAGESRARRRVIVIDDSEDTTSSLAVLLQAAGCDVLTFASGAGLIEEAARFAPDVVFVDLDLGSEPSGVELARQLRSEPRIGRPLIAAVTGWARDQDRTEAAEAGCDLFFAKPADPEQLVAVALQGDRRRSGPGFRPFGIERRRASMPRHYLQDERVTRS